jgi:hypothetical protein
MIPAPMHRRNSERKEIEGKKKKDIHATPLPSSELANDEGTGNKLTITV